MGLCLMSKIMLSGRYIWSLTQFPRNTFGPGGSSLQTASTTRRSVDQLAHKQQISSLTPHYSAQREHFSSTRCNIHWNTVVTFIFSNRAANCRNFIDNKTTQLHYGTEEVEKEYENGIRFNTNNTSVFKSAVLPFPAVAVNSVCVHHYCHCIECIKN